MKINKCKTCEHYNIFFDSCSLYYDEIYLGEGDFEYRPVSIKRITQNECKYKKKKC